MAECAVLKSYTVPNAIAVQTEHSDGQMKLRGETI